MDFRVALVVITTLVVTERPLSAGAKDLVWAPWLSTWRHTWRPCGAGVEKKGARDSMVMGYVWVSYKVRNPYIYNYIYI